jgi:hypothetical protein
MSQQNALSNNGIPDMSPYSPEVIRAIETLRSHIGDSQEIVNLLASIPNTVDSLLESESYKHGKRLEEARKMLKQTLQDRKNYYDPLLMPEQSKRELSKFVAAAKYMGAYPQSESNVSTEAEGNLPPLLEFSSEMEKQDGNLLRGDEYYKAWLGPKL